MRLTPEEFHAWCQRLHLRPETEALIATLRESQPVRKVRGRAQNVSGRYPSPKMGVSIQFESQHVELWAIYAMERDDDVLEFYDQSSRIPLHYHAKSGRRTTQWHTPDFFVLRRSSAGWEEWKPASRLEKLVQDQPGRYVGDATENWHCPPGEAYAEPFGLTYRLRSSAEYPALYIENLKLLQDFWAHPAAPDPAQAEQLCGLVERHPGIRLSTVLETLPDLAVDVVWAELSLSRLFTDLFATSLMRHDLVRLFLEEEHISHTQASLGPTGLHQPSFPCILFDGRVFLVETFNDQVLLHPEVGSPLSLPDTQFQQLGERGIITSVPEGTPSPISSQVRTALDRADSRAQKAANARLEQIVSSVCGEEVTASPRSIQRWMRAYQTAEQQSGCGYLGLLDRVADRGNRFSRLADPSRELLQTYLKEHYEDKRARRAKAVYHLYVSECERLHIPPASLRTFYRERAQMSSPEVLTARLGKRAAYTHHPFFWHLDRTTPRHGERPFARAHLDHAQLDLLLVSSVTGKPLAKPWLTMLVDAYSRRVLACSLSYDPPSYRSAMMVFRECVRRYQRLPQELVVDRGADFGSTYFETLLARYFITKLERPPQAPRFGSVIERLFGTSTTMLLNQLSGNTQATKTPRLLTREVDPKQQAVWTLQRFTECFSQWAFEVYDQMEHPALFQSPRAAYDQGMAKAGARLHRLIPYSEEFLMHTRPTTHTGRAKISSSHGITVNGLRYWNPAFALPDVSGSQAEVRYEPFDMGVVYAFVKGHWVECLADQYAQVHDRTEREWHLLLEEWREHQRQHSKKRVSVNGMLQAHFLEELESQERVFLQQQRDHEERLARSHNPREQRTHFESEAGAHARESPPVELDLSRIPHFEEYR